MLLRSDLKCVLGGSKTLLANTFLHMLETLYTKYKARLADLTFFEPVMPQCVAMLNALCQQHNNMDMPHDGLIGFVDGHFQVRYKPEPCPPHLTMRHYGMRSALLPQKITLHTTQATNRPGGAGCVRHNLFDTDVYNGKVRRFAQQSTPLYPPPACPFLLLLLPACQHNCYVHNIHTKLADMRS